MPTYRMNYATAPLATESHYYYDLFGQPHQLFFSPPTYAMHGRDFDDRCLGGGLNDYIRGKDGNDHLFGLGGDDYLFGGDGSDVISGGDGQDYLIGDSELDPIGNDKLYGGAGNDFLFGGLGQNTLDGGDGRDTVDYSWINTGGMTVNLEKTSFQYMGVGVWDKLVSVEDVVGTNYYDTLIGNNDGNLLLGLGGNDTIHGKGGNDTIYGNEGNDLISGGAGNDYLRGDASYEDSAQSGIPGGNDALYGGDGNDVLVGGVGRDVLYGGDGSDLLIANYFYNDPLDTWTGNIYELDSNKLYGGDGNDMLICAGTNDRLEGGAGADIFVFDRLDGSEVPIRIVDFDPDEGDKIAFLKDYFDTSVENFYEDFVRNYDVRQAGNDTYINVQYNSYYFLKPIILEGVQVDSLSADNFISTDRGNIGAVYHDLTGDFLFA